MFDIKEYFSDFNDYIRKGEYFSTSLETRTAEEDISSDIDNLLKNRFDSLYLRDKFKHDSMGVEIIYPRITYPRRKVYIRSSDYIRFLLSLYPQKSDFENIDKIVLRPRHIEIEDIELMALYIRKRKILVLYLYTPHYYTIKNSKFKEYTELSNYSLPDLVNTSMITNLLNINSVISKTNTMKAPPLWYILSIVSNSEDSNIDKFFIKKDRNHSRDISRILDEISFYYSRHGY